MTQVTEAGPPSDDKSARLHEALLRGEFERAIEKYETDAEFRTTVQRIRDSIIGRRTKEVTPNRDNT